MVLRFSRPSTACAAWIASLCGAFPLAAQDRFIVQPSYRASAATAAPSPAGPSSATASLPQSPHIPLSVASLPAAPQAASGPPADESATPTPTQSLWRARGATPTAPATPTAAPATASSTPAPGATERRVGPVEIRNPNFPAAAAEAVTSAVPTPTPTTNSTSSLAWVAQEQAAPQPGGDGSGKTLASLVSSQILTQPRDSSAAGPAVAAIDAPPGWQAIGHALGQRISNCEMLLNRHAYFSAREESEAAFLYLARVLDLMSNSYTSEPAWHTANKALQEAEDFSTAQRLTSDSDFMRRLILSHETPVLKEVNASELAPLAAAQHYRQYAENKLVEASQGHPWASEIAYALGRTYQAQADAAEDGARDLLRWRAVTLYRGARGIAPDNAMAANQLGYVLLQMDRPQDARQALLDSLRAQPSLPALENLVEASRRMGDAATGQWAAQQVLALKDNAPPPNTAPEVIEVDPRTFAALSPYAAGPTAGAPSASPTPRTASAGPPPANY